MTSAQRTRVRLILTGMLVSLLSVPFTGPAVVASAASPLARQLAAARPSTTVPQAAAKKTRITKNLPATATLDLSKGVRSTTLKVKATGKTLRYTWQARTPAASKWKTAKKKGKSATFKVTTKWSKGTRFRVVVSGKRGKVTSKTAVLKVVPATPAPTPTPTPVVDPSTLRRGVDLSAYQYGANLAAIADWAGPNGFTILRNASGARPVQTDYTSLCGGAKLNTGTVPVVEDCAYAGFAKDAAARGVSLGHYWFNGWTTSTDPTVSDALPAGVFANGYTVQASAQQFVDWLIRDGSYGPASTDPLVLDIEKGRAWTTTAGGSDFTASLRAWKPKEAAEFVAAVKARMATAGLHANLYLYMSANAASAKTATGEYVWAPLATSTRLWVASWGKDNGQVPDIQPKTGPWQTWSIWQYTSKLKIAGSRTTELDADLAKPDAWTPLG